MKYLFPFLVLLFCNSCQYFKEQLLSEKEVLAQKLKEINWNEVDEFPSLAACEKITNKTQRQECFFEILAQLVQEKLSCDTLGVDTIKLKVTIFSDAVLQFEPQFSKDTLNFKKIDSILKIRLVDFPKVHPAIKRGIPVKTQFILPVVLNEEE